MQRHLLKRGGKMSKIIQEYYEQVHVLPLLVKQKIRRFDQNRDIAEEFEFWIQNKTYKQDSPIMIEKYTAEKIAAISPYMDGEAAFITLLDLREYPDKTLKKIASGFDRK